MAIPSTWPQPAQERAKAFLTLLKYFYNSAAMAEAATRFVDRHQAGEKFDRDDSFRSAAFLSYWFASLCVLIEGWRELALADPSIDALLGQSDHVSTLRRFRNGTFHFQRRYDHPKFLDFQTNATLVGWSMRVTAAFAEYFAPHVDAIDTPRIEHWLMGST